MSGMDVISFRIPKELKKSIKELDINWSEEVRRFIEDKVREYKREKALEEIEKSGLKHETGAMSTTIEAKSLDEIFEVIKRAHEAIVGMGAKRIHIDLRIDHRLDKEATIESKKRAVQ